MSGLIKLVLNPMMSGAAVAVPTLDVAKVPVEKRPAPINAGA